MNTPLLDADEQPLTPKQGTALRKRIITRHSLYWLTALSLLMLSYKWFPDLSPGSKYDTFSTSLTGKKAFYRLMKNSLLKERKSFVSRNDTQLSIYLRELSTSQTLCLLGPIQYPDKQTWADLLNWVDRGGSLVIAAHAQNSETLKIPELNISVEKGSYRNDYNQSVTSKIIDSDMQIHWSSNAFIKMVNAETLVKTPGGIQAIRQQYGRGAVTVIATDQIFTNESMFYENNAALALRLLTEGQTGDGFEVDESLNLSAMPKAVGLLLEMPFRPLLILCLVIILLYCWWQHFRFGPLQPKAVIPRRNIVAHTDAVGIMYYKSQSGNAAVRAYLKQLIDQLKLRANKGKEHRVLDPIAARMGTTTDGLMQLLSSTATAVRRTKITRKSAAEMIRKLATIRHASIVKKK